MRLKRKADLRAEIPLGRPDRERHIELIRVETTSHQKRRPNGTSLEGEVGFEPDPR